MRKDEDTGNVWLPLDRETRERLMERARMEGDRNPLEVAVDLLKAALIPEAARRPTLN